MNTIIACVLMMAAMAAGQSARAIGQAPPAAAAPAPAAGVPAAPAGPTYGPAFFGPGINNPLARIPIQQLVLRAQEVVASNPNVRVFVDVDGSIEFTDQFGREVEVLDSFGRDALEIPGLEEHLEFQKQQAKLNQRRALLMQQLASLGSVTGQFPLGGVAPGAAPIANRFIIAT